MNFVMMNGTMGNEPNLAVTKNGREVVSFRVVVRGERKIAEEDRYPMYNFFCEAWGPVARFIMKYCPKGCKVCMVGKLVVTHYFDKNAGRTIYTTKIMVDAIESNSSMDEREDLKADYRRQNNAGNGFMNFVGDDADDGSNVDAMYS